MSSTLVVFDAFIHRLEASSKPAPPRAVHIQIHGASGAASAEGVLTLARPSLPVLATLSTGARAEVLSDRGVSLVAPFAAGASAAAVSITLVGAARGTVVIGGDCGDEGDAFSEGGDGETAVLLGTGALSVAGALERCLRGDAGPHVAQAALDLGGAGMAASSMPRAIVSVKVTAVPRDLEPFVAQTLAATAAAAAASGGGAGGAGGVPISREWAPAASRAGASAAAAVITLNSGQPAPPESAVPSTGSATQRSPSGRAAAGGARRADGGGVPGPSVTFGPSAGGIRLPGAPPPALSSAAAAAPAHEADYIPTLTVTGHDICDSEPTHSLDALLADLIREHHAAASRLRSVTNASASARMSNHAASFASGASASMAALAAGLVASGMTERSAGTLVATLSRAHGVEPLSPPGAGQKSRALAFAGGATTADDRLTPLPTHRGLHELFPLSTSALGNTLVADDVAEALQSVANVAVGSGKGVNASKQKRAGVVAARGGAASSGIATGGAFRGGIVEGASRNTTFDDEEVVARAAANAHPVTGVRLTNKLRAQIAVRAAERSSNNSSQRSIGGGSATLKAASPRSPRQAEVQRTPPRAVRPPPPPPTQNISKISAPNGGSGDSHDSPAPADESFSRLLTLSAANISYERRGSYGGAEALRAAAAARKAADVMAAVRSVGAFGGRSDGATPPPPPSPPSRAAPLTSSANANRTESELPSRSSLLVASNASAAQVPTSPRRAEAQAAGAVLDVTGGSVNISVAATSLASSGGPGSTISGGTDASHASLLHVTRASDGDGGEFPARAAHSPAPGGAGAWAGVRSPDAPEAPSALFVSALSPEPTPRGPPRSQPHSNSRLLASLGGGVDYSLASVSTGSSASDDSGGGAAMRNAAAAARAALDGVVEEDDDGRGGGSGASSSSDDDERAVVPMYFASASATSAAAARAKDAAVARAAALARMRALDDVPDDIDSPPNTALDAYRQRRNVGAPQQLFRDPPRGAAPVVVGSPDEDDYEAGSDDDF